MYHETIEKAAALSVKKKEFLTRNFLGYGVSSALAGIFIGLSVVLVFSLAAPFSLQDNPATKLIFSACFAIALSLVIFSGSELFTGNTMIMTFGLAKRRISLLDWVRICGYSWFGNLLGCILLVLTVILAGSVTHSYPFLVTVALQKIQSSPVELLARGTLCNILVCLAVWMSLRTTSDSAKLILIFWCLLGFTGSGYDHSIANMALISLAIATNPGIEGLNWAGYSYNIFFVTLGNIIGGALVVAGGYLLTCRHQDPATLKPITQTTT